MRAQVTIDTRPPKQVRSLADLTTEWRTRAGRALGGDPTAWAQALTSRTADRAARGLLRADDVPPDAVVEVARATVGAVSENRSTWKHWNLWAEASRQTLEWRFASTPDREAAVAAVVEEAKRISISLTPPELAYSPDIVPAQRRHQPVPPAPCGLLLLRGDPRRRGATPRPRRGQGGAPGRPRRDRGRRGRGRGQGSAGTPTQRRTGRHPRQHRRLGATGRPLDRPGRRRQDDRDAGAPRRLDQGPRARQRDRARAIGRCRRGARRGPRRRVRQHREVAPRASTTAEPPSAGASS